MIDCAEGSQTQLRVFHQKMNAIGHIFISHLHGDHFFGLPGLVSSMHLMGRTEPVEIFAPAGIQQALSMMLEVSGSHLDFEIHYHELTHTEGCMEIFQNKRCRISAFPLIHSVPTYGYLVEGIAGNQMLRYAYCCDTGYTEQILPYIHGADMLCIESTFDDAFLSYANEKFHCTASQAATLALKGEVESLLLTHLSARYKTPELILSQAQAIFPITQIAEDGKRYDIKKLSPE